MYCRVGLNNGGGVFKVVAKSGAWGTDKVTARTEVVFTFINSTVANNTASRGGRF